MSYNGSGTFNINTAGQPVVTGTTITSTAFNLLTADLATGLSTALTKDGQTTPTANIPLGGFKITSLGAGTAATDAAQYGQLQAGATTIATVTGTDTYVGTLTPAIAAYATGNLFSFVAPNTNTGAATINLNSLGAKNITKLGSTALAAGDIVSGRVYQIEYDGTRFQLLNPSASTVASFSAGSTGFTPSSATTGAVTLAGTLATTNGGTGLTSFTSGGVVYASSSSALATGSALVFNGTNLGVGTSSPTQKLTVAGTSGDTRILLTDSTASSNLFIGVNSSTIDIKGVNGYPMVFYTGNTERMRLDTSGNLGIGTSSPSVKLDVASGNVNFSNSAQVTQLISSSTSAGNQPTLSWQHAGNNTFSIKGGSDLLFYSDGTTNLRMTLNNSGNLGLGVTPSPGNAGTCLEAGYAGNIFRGGTVNDANIDSNAYYNSGWKYANTGYATRYGCGNAAGQHLWFTAPSGTAGNAITFTQAMTLDASGNLLVGTTSASITNGGIWMPPGGGSSSVQIGHASGTASGNVYINFGYSSNTIGSVTQSGTTAVLYNLTSDQRLKNDLGAVISTDVISNTVIHDFTWKSDGSKARGVFAQEAAKVIPSAVKVGDDGEEVTDTWQVDYSKYVPDIIVELQSLRAELAALKSQLKG